MTDKYLEPDETLEPEVAADQIRFGWEKPLFEKNQVSTLPRTQSNPPSAPSKWYQKPLVLAALALCAVLFLLVMVLLLLRQPEQPTVVNEPSPSPIANPIADPLKQRIIELRNDLQTADPTRQEYPFPPVSMDLQLDPQE